MAAESVTAIDIAQRLRIPEFREAAERAGYVAGVDTGVETLCVELAKCGYYLTPELARAAKAWGWNLRCNRCGSYGALWVREQRPEWESLALCSQHRQELASELDRHKATLRVLRNVNFKHEPQTINRGRCGEEN